MKVVFDTNVLVSAFVAEGLCSVLLRRASQKEFFLIVCPKILDEFERVLSKKLKVPHALIEKAVQLILEISQLIEPTVSIQPVCRHQDDNEILACAVSAKADYLVSGDNDLLEIRCFSGVKIISPREFESLFED